MKMKKGLRKLITLIIAAVLVFGAFVACDNNGKNRSNATKTIGVCMPESDVDRWKMDGDYIKKQLEAKQYNVMLEYAENSSEKQIRQINNMIDNNCRALIIAAPDCYVLDDVLKRAAENNIKIIAYDRLIMDTEYVDYLCTFDQFIIGVEQAKCIENAFSLDRGGGPVTMEIFSGATDDSTSPEVFEGQMSILKKYIDNGKIVIPSGQKDLTTTAIRDWSAERATARMKDLLGRYYRDGITLDAVLASNDSIALGVIYALKDAGYGSDGGPPLPVLTGQDGELANVKAIINGEQTMTLFIDVRALATKAVEMVDDLMLGKVPKTHDKEKYDNGKKVVPASICMPITIDKDNYMELIEEGYYKEADLM